MIAEVERQQIETEIIYQVCSTRLLRRVEVSYLVVRGFSVKSAFLYRNIFIKVLYAEVSLKKKEKKNQVYGEELKWAIGVAFSFFSKTKEEIKFRYEGN